MTSPISSSWPTLTFPNVSKSSRTKRIEGDPYKLVHGNTEKVFGDDDRPGEALAFEF